MAQRTTFAAVAAAARGRWPEIWLAAGIAPEFTTRTHGPCLCGGRDRRRNDDRDGRGTFICSGGGADPVAGDGFDFLCHALGWRKAEALHFVAQLLGMDAENDPQKYIGGIPRISGASGADGADCGPTRPTRPTYAEITPPRVLRASERLRRLWRESQPITASEVPAAVAAYLHGRGLGDALGDLPEDLRYHAALRYYEPDQSGPRLVGTWPALLAVVRDPAGEPITLHRTWLDPDGGKAPVPCPRKLAPLREGATMTGAAIRLYQPTDGRLILAEGTETAIAGRLLRPEWGAWATVSAGGMASVEPPDDVQQVLILADHDRAGIEAAHRAGDRLAEHCEVAIALPPDGPGTDWADVIATTTPDPEDAPA
jgi:putative DNA primase/helicase